jgi:5'/3'-nucleotidase SurE
MRILVTNDDGVASPGLWALSDALIAAGHDVSVVAPSSERSGAGAAIGHIVPGEGVAVTPVDRPGYTGRAWALDGAPALCVLLALRSEHFGSGFEAVVSGINPGYNTGLSVIHSGTVGAALTAGNAALSAVAVSLEAQTRQVGEVGLVPGIHEHWSTAADLAVRLVAGLPSLPVPTVLFIDLLASIPSVVFGLFGFLYLSRRLKPAMGSVHGAVGGVPVLGRLFGEPSGDGRSFFVAGLILALMVTPIITSITREVFETTPAGQKEAALALGSTRWEMIRGAVLPHSKPGVIGAVMLGLGRAMGETIAAALVIGSVLPGVRANLFGTGDAMAAVIVNDFPEAGSLHKSALVALGVVLFVMTILVNLVARVVVARGRATT